ncbi:interferon-induced very large GTPase 1-like isoform X2 [Thunnus albacares]|uniref:interferon-induced very large GTPase 1-like isoform X2 n=1 Tax=Thunnus albacares TaxID=8236 RepID=UPI001CF719CF|nr:interferon-induced very large GTPase 1-like isoform X2 [Thunnus albacares]
METEDHDNTAAGGEPEVEFENPPVANDKACTAVEELEKSETEAERDPVNEPSEAEHSERNDETTSGESEITVEVPTASDKKAGEADDVKEVHDENISDISEQTAGESDRLECTSQSVAREIKELTTDRTLVLVGDTNSIEIGSNNLLLDHDVQTNEEQFSHKLYDLFGRRIYVINMLGLQNIDKFPLKRGIHAFLLLLQNGLHISQYSSGVQWLEKTFGKGSLPYLLTVVTHKTDEKCESALTELEANSGEKRYLTCNNSMMDVNDIIALFKNIDDLVSENDPHCYSGLMCDDKDQLDPKSQEEERINSSVSQQNQTVDESEKNASAIKLKCHPVTQPGDAEHSEKNDGSTTSDGKPQDKSVKTSAPNEKACTAVEELEKSETEAKCDPVNDPSEAEHSERNNETTSGESEITVEVPTASDKKVDESEKNASAIKLKCHPVTEPGDAEHSEKNDGSTTSDGKPQDKSVKTSAPNEKACTAVEELEESETEAERDPVNEPNEAEHSERNNETTSGESEITVEVPTASDKKVDESDKNASAIKLKCHPVTEPGDAEHSEKSDGSTTSHGEPQDKSVKTSAPNEKACTAVEELEESETEAERDPVNEPNEAEHSERNNETTSGESEITVEVPTASDKKVDESDKNASAIKLKCHPVTEPGDAEHSEKSDGSTTSHGEPQDKSVKTSAPNEKGTLHTDADGNKDEKSEKVSEEKRKEQYQSLLSRLHLQQKLTPADFLRISQPVKQQHDTSEKDLAHTFLQRLMMLDYRARYIPVKQDSPEMSCSKPQNTETEEEEEEDDFARLSSSADSLKPKLSHVHPMDVQMAVFHCSDSFLKQNMITKLSQCQYALPLLVPDPVTMDIKCPLWTFRQITKSWKITQTKDDSNIVTMKSMPICKAETHMVSFFRLGSLSESKSQLINTLINDRHSTFFHRNCKGSTKSRHLIDGVAEIAWYCPAGKHDDAFTDCIAFCNLHGDALLIEKQRKILIEKSSVNVVLLQTLQKNHKSWTVVSALLKATKPLICLIVDDDCGAVKIREGKYKMGLKDRSHSDVGEELKEIIGKILSGQHTSFQLETMAEVAGIKVDEDDSVYQKGKSAAMKIVNLLQKMNVSKIKDKYLPCQGRLWHEWCRKNKEQYHLKGHIEKEKCENQKELERIRQKQCDASFSELIQLFIQSLSSLSPKEKEYFLKWLQILLDSLSTDDLSSVLQEYDEKWSEVLDLKKKRGKSDQLIKKQIELEKISAKLQSATFGLEHIFREIGQIYEAHKSLKKQTKQEKTDWSKYPELAAELMIAGQPMELMDGDAGHVPLTWISSLLDEVINKLRDKRIFVLSVLGLQSSGKSTMLNAMFGLQFAVSAGRCTKGAFMQLVKVSEEMKMKFDYVLVVDTEGLRALELAGNATLHHDNELATFVVGLGNMTLINIFGENPADMQDVLQIVVQAIMRMKKVKLSPSCVFVHQNVTDIGAAEKNMDGKRRLQEKLDEMAKLAAKEEVYDAECFNDIIAFDVQKDVKYFAQLWEGSPPMAPPNPGYSESIQDLKNFILSKASKSAGTTLPKFKSNIKDLWEALLKENFVFSFKNTLEIAVYRKLEVQYVNWTWALRSNMLTVENQLYNRIENGKLEKVDPSNLYKEMSNTYEEVKKDMKVYFDDDRDKEILAQWRGRFEIKIEEFHDEQVRGVKRKLDEVIQQKNACKKLDEKKAEFEKMLLQKSKELAKQLKDKAKDEEELKTQFNHVWSGLVTELTGDTKPIKDINLVQEQTDIVQELGIEWSLIEESQSSENYKKISTMGDYSKYVTLTKHQELCNKSQQSQDGKKGNKNTKEQGGWGFFEKFLKHSQQKNLQHEEQQQITSLIDNVAKQSIGIIKGKPVATRGYSQTYLQEVAKNVKEKVTEFENTRKYALKKEFTVDLLLYVFDMVGSWLVESHNKFKAKNDAVTFVESKKMQYYNIFRSFCKGNSSAVVLGELICDKLKVSTVEAVCNKTAIDLAGEMRCNSPAFKGNRLNLEKHVLKSLAEKEDFDSYISYIRHPRKQAEIFIREEVKKYIFTEHKAKALDILKKNVDDINNLVSQALFTATERVKNQRGDTDMWLKEFSSLLKENDELTFDTICCQDFSDINKFDFLKEEIEKGLRPIIQDLRRLSLDKMQEFRLKPDQILIDQLCKCCWVTCPFCSAVCTNTLEDHSPDDHSVPFHRSNAITGWHYRNTDELSIEFCTTKVASDLSFYPHPDSDELIPYKLYRTGGPEYANWRIDHDESKLAYWKWFVCRFQEQLEDHYELKFKGRGEIPSEWKTHSKEEAIKSLDEMCE